VDVAQNRSGHFPIGMSRDFYSARYGYNQTQRMRNATTTKVKKVKKINKDYKEAENSLIIVVFCCMILYSLRDMSF
jgi:hypothetical protein